MTIEEQYKMIIELKITSEEALRLITKINGLSQKTLNDVVWATTGHSNLKDFCEWEDIYYPDEEE